MNYPTPNKIAIPTPPSYNFVSENRKVSIEVEQELPPLISFEQYIDAVNRGRESIWKNINALRFHNPIEGYEDDLFTRKPIPGKTIT